jgi:hypothetical protein
VTRVRAGQTAGMTYELVTQPAPLAYIASDLTYDETLADYRTRVGSGHRRRWWVAAR